MVNSNTILFSKLQAWCHTYVVFSKSLVFSWVLVATTSFAEFAVTSVITDYLADVLNDDIAKSAMISNGLDVLLSSLGVVPHYSESYVGLFNVITFYAGVYVAGLMLLCVFESRPPDLFKYTKIDSFMLLCLGFIVVNMGKSSLKSALLDFLDGQLNQKVNSESENMKREAEQEERIRDVRFGIWFYSAWLAGAGMTAFFPAVTEWALNFKISALLMGAGYLVFYSGCIFYSLEKPTLREREPKETQVIAVVRKVCRVYMAALRKRKLDYPASPDGYHWNNHTQNHFYTNRGGHIQFFPKAFGMLDKAAITTADKKDKCSVKEVREVKRVSSVIVLFLTVLPYGLLPPTSTGFFVLQGDDMYSSYNLSVLFVMKLGLGSALTWLFWWRRLESQNVTRVRILCGMVCSVLCCFTAWRVERYRLFSNHWVSMSLLIPQFLLLGLAEALIEDGLYVFYRNHAPPSMQSFSEPLVEFLFAMGRLLALLLTFIFSAFGWLKITLDNSRVDRYYLLLAILNFAFLFIYGFYSRNQAFTEPYPEDEQEQNHETQQNH